MRERRDEIAGFGAGLAFAVGLAVASSLATITVLVAWLHVADISGMLRPEEASVAAAIGWWVAFWLALSAGLLAALWLSSRAWHVLSPVQRRREATREDREAREAVTAAVAIVEDARRVDTRRT